MKAFIHRSIAGAACVIVLAARLSAGQFVNGGFESDLTGWTPSGDVFVKSGSPYSPTEGSKLAAFNSGNSFFGGRLSQSVTTSPGRSYKLEFDVGILPFKAGHHLMRVSISSLRVGQSSSGIQRLTELIKVFFVKQGPDGGATTWETHTYYFSAPREFVSVSFEDTSVSATALDLVLDNVRLTEVPPDPIKGSLENGSFESGLAGWEADGNVSVKGVLPVLYNPTDGTRLAAFNSGNSKPGGQLRQTVATIPGNRYRLQFDAGNLSFNSQHQRLRVVAVTAAGSYVDDTIDIPGPGGGATSWIPASYDFTAISNSVTLWFQDESVATISLDLVLDRIRLTDVTVPLLVNGGFESGLAGWTATGNVAPRSGAIYAPTEGVQAAAFNAGDSTPGGKLSQEIQVVSGRRYTLEFDVGNLSFNTQLQRMRVQVQYRSAGNLVTLVDQTINVAGNGTGTTQWEAESFDFTPQSGTLVVTFTDVSASTNSVDLVLDRVRLTP